MFGVRCIGRGWAAGGRRVAAALLTLGGTHVGAAAEAPARALARELALEGDHDAAALEFRRLAMEASADGGRSGWYWAAAHEYWRAGDPDRARAMLDRAEETGGAPAAGLRWLRAGIAGSAGDAGTAEFHWQGLAEPGGDEAARRLAARELAALRLREGRLDAAGGALDLSPAPEQDARAALETYRAGRDRSPRIGGWLGLVPGLGHAYSGEYANGARALILNGLFLWAAVDQANRENWGAVAAIGFLELTWYSGSVYGGVDAAHRHNRRRADEAVEAIRGGARAEPDYEALPLVRLRYVF